MPFTPAHVVAAVPLAPLLGRRGVVSALAIGAMAPDLSYFLPLEIPRWESHSIGALFWFCLPVGLAVWIALQTCMAPLLHDVSPAGVRARLPAAWASGAWPKASLTSVGLCIIVGATTHLMWDSFTHAGTPLAHAFPMITRPLARIGGYTVRPVTFLQHGSTLLGFTLIGAWARRWWLQSTPQSVGPALPPMLRALLVALVLGPALWIGIEAAVLRFGWPDEPMLKLQQAAVGIVLTGGSVFFWSLAVVAAGWRMLRALPSLRTAAGGFEAG